MRNGLTWPSRQINSGVLQTQELVLQSCKLLESCWIAHGLVLKKDPAPWS